jgi:hypothetical protein
MTGGLGNDVKASRTQGIETASFKLKSPGVQIDDNSSTEHLVPMVTMSSFPFLSDEFVVWL